MFQDEPGLGGGGDGGHHGVRWNPTLEAPRDTRLWVSVLGARLCEYKGGCQTRERGWAGPPRRRQGVMCRQFRSGHPGAGTWRHHDTVRARFRRVSHGQGASVRLESGVVGWGRGDGGRQKLPVARSVRAQISGKPPLESPNGNGRVVTCVGAKVVAVMACLACQGTLLSAGPRGLAARLNRDIRCWHSVLELTSMTTSAGRRCAF